MPSTGLTITNPLVLYRALLATKRIDPDPAQHRLALHLQTLYHRLKDYEPTVEYATRLKQITKAVGEPSFTRLGIKNGPGNISSEVPRNGSLFGFWESKEKRDSLALTEVLNSHQAALRIDSPKGLLLHGEVGTGKSMLVDLLASSLPNKKKRRWHFNTFMLETFNRLETLRCEQARELESTDREEHSLLWLARDLISSSPILFLDEFQLPDRAASKILSNLLTPFFQLGGVLIATSNRMPDELAKATGMDYGSTSPETRSRRWTWSKGGTASDNSTSDRLFGGQGEFAGFLEVLKARCEVWDIEGGRDWRRREAEEAEKVEAMIEAQDGPYQDWSGRIRSETEDSYLRSTALPPKYHISQPGSPLLDTDKAWTSLLHDTVSTYSPSSPIPWQLQILRVYNRPLPVPCAHDGICLFTFTELCASNLGPADYITLASTFHTFIVLDVPVLTWLKKNEARRFITLLDALYEARCKLLIRAEAGPDEIFFPEESVSPASQTPRTTSSLTTSSSSPPPSSDSLPSDPSDPDATYAETLAEIHQDLTFPFRPNISSYSPSLDPADEDSDFGPTHRSLETDRERDFRNSTAFTGEDERFAYKRARSRLWEMCGRRWWARGTATATGVDDETEGDASQGVHSWWRPLPLEVRRWEYAAPSDSVLPSSPEHAASSSSLDLSAASEDEKRTLSPFRVSVEPPPKLSWVHAWGMMRWGRKAGRWGQGVEGLDEQQPVKEEGKSGGEEKG